MEYLINWCLDYIHWMCIIWSLTNFNGATKQSSILAASKTINQFSQNGFCFREYDAMRFCSLNQHPHKKLYMMTRRRRKIRRNLTTANVSVTIIARLYYRAINNQIWRRLSYLDLLFSTTYASHLILLIHLCIWFENFDVMHIICYRLDRQIIASE